jgi:hypothetical protein
VKKLPSTGFAQARSFLTGFLALLLVPISSMGAPETDQSKSQNLGEALIRVDEKVDEIPLEPSAKPIVQRKELLGSFSPSMVVPRLGFGVAAPEVKDSSGFLGLIYAMESESFRPWEFGFDFLLNGLLQFQLSKRWIYFPRDSVRPSFKMGLNWKPNPVIGLGNLMDWNRFQLRLGLGLDDLNWVKTRLRWEIELALSPVNIQFLISIGFPIPL